VTKKIPKKTPVRKSSKDPDLWDLIKSGRKKTRLLGKVEQFLMLREGDDRDHTVLHPSAMAKSDWCPRAAYFQLAQGTPDESNTHWRLEMIFDEGKNIHEKWQTRLWDMEVLSGTWACNACYHKWEDVSPTQCPHCSRGKKLLEYREVSLRDDEHLIAGHADGQIEDGGSPALLEIKSVGVGTVRNEAPHLLKRHTHTTEQGTKVVDADGLWDSIQTPFPSHMRQARIYLWLAKIDQMVVLYESKMNQSVKEFLVSRDDSFIQDRLDGAKDIAYAMRGGPYPRCPKYPTSCKSCAKFETEESDDEADGSESNVQQSEEGSTPGSGAGGVRGRRAVARPSPRERRRRAARPAERPDGDVG